MRVRCGYAARCADERADVWSRPLVRFPSRPSSLTTLGTVTTLANPTMPSQPTDFQRSFEPPRSLLALDIATDDAAWIRARLASAPLVLMLPVAMNAAYVRYRGRDLGRYLRIGAPLLAVLIISLSLLQTEFFDGTLAAGDTTLWTYGTVAMSIALVTAAGAVQLPPIRRWYEAVASTLGSAVLLKLAVMPQLLVSLEARAIESYFCMMTVFLVTVALRLRLVTAIAATLTTAVLALSVIFATAPAPDLRAFAFYFGAAASVGLFVAWQLEEKEKTAFLQAVLIEHDARERESLNRELVRLSRYDGLTGIANRRELERRLDIEWSRLAREGRELAVVFADIDYFKAFNDAYGHAAGDQCLASVANALATSLLRPADFVARYGGEEFVLVLPETDEAGAIDVARRVLAAIDALAIAHRGAPELGHVTVSLGVASQVASADASPEQLLERADQALYAAKHAGRHRVALASSSLSEGPGLV